MMSSLLDQSIQEENMSVTDNMGKVTSSQWDLSGWDPTRPAVQESLNPRLDGHFSGHPTHTETPSSVSYGSKLLGICPSKHPIDFHKNANNWFRNLWILHNFFLRRTVLVKEEFPITQREDTDGKIILEVLDLTRACVESNLPSLKMDQVCSAFCPIGAVASIDQQWGPLTWLLEQQSLHTKGPLLYG